MGEPLLTPNEFTNIIQKAHTMYNIGNTPKLRNNDRFGIYYQSRYVNYVERKIKALSKLHLYLVSLKPKMKEVERYIQEHPNTKEADEYKELLKWYTDKKAWVLNEIKVKKDRLSNEKELLESSLNAEKYHKNVEMPAAKLALPLMNQDKAAANAQDRLYKVLRNQEIKNAKEAQKRFMGLDTDVKLLYLNKNSQKRREVREKEAEEAWMVERQKLQNVAENKFEGWNTILRERNKRFGIVRNTTQKRRTSRRQTRRKRRGV